MKINFEQSIIHEICGVTDERAKEIALIFAKACVEIEENYKDYQYTIEDGKHKGEAALHRGKILNRILQGVTDEQEILMACFSLDHIEQKLCRQIATNEIKAALLGGLKEGIDKLFGKKTAEKVFNDNLSQHPKDNQSGI